MRDPHSPRRPRQYKGYFKRLASIPFRMNELRLSGNFTRLAAPAHLGEKKVAFRRPREAQRGLNKIKSFRRTHMHRTLLSVFALLLVAFGARADQVILKNGDRLTGKIVTGDGKTLLLKSEFAGDVTIQWDAIPDIDPPENTNTTQKGPPRLSGKVTTQNGKFVVAGAPAATVPSVA